MGVRSLQLHSIKASFKSWATVMEKLAPPEQHVVKLTTATNISHVLLSVAYTTPIALQNAVK